MTPLGVFLGFAAVTALSAAGAVVIHRVEVRLQRHVNRALDVPDLRVERALRAHPSNVRRIDNVIRLPRQGA